MQVSTAPQKPRQGPFKAAGECLPCATFAQNPKHGGYQMQCLACCARLVQSARPSKALAAGMLAAIERSKLAPTRETILKAIRTAQDARKPSGQG